MLPLPTEGSVGAAHRAPATAPPAASEAVSPGGLPSGPCSPAAEVAGLCVFSFGKATFSFACAPEVLGPEHCSMQAVAG